MNTVRYYAVVVILFTSSTVGQNEESLIAELQLADMELQDDCENLAQAFKTALTTNNYSDWVDAMREHANYLRSESDSLKSYEDFISFDLERNWTMMVKSGDSLLVDEDWNTLVSYYVGNEELMRTTKVRCRDDFQDCPVIKDVYEEILQSRRNETILKKSWTAWQSLLSLRKKDYPNVLSLVHKAAAQNDHSDAKSYWEMLLDLPEAYQQADALWEEIQPFYRKLHNFVKTRIFKFYGIEDGSSEIPVYLLGSNYGHDWSYVADLVLPHPQIHYNAKSYLKKIKIKDIFNLAENLTEELSLGSLGDKFWDKSVFNVTYCDNHVISFCSEEYSEVMTCNKTSWTTYLNAFESAVDIALKNVNYLTLPRSQLRSLVIDEAIKSLGSVLAITNMRFNGILNKELFSSLEDDDPNKMTELLLVALRILPKLPFYLAADKWRLHLLENDFRDISKTWWNYRNDLQGVTGVFNNETDFLGDQYITSNQPYLSKFFGTIVQFQLLQYYRLDMLDPQDSVASYIGKDETFLSMIREKSSKEWLNLIESRYFISEVSALPLLDYFQPLEHYLDTAPLEQQPFTTESSKPVTKKNRIEKEHSEIRKNKSKSIEAPVDLKPSVVPKQGENIKRSSNENKDTLIMYFGIGLLITVVGIVIGSRIAKQKRKSKNRRLK